MNRNDRHTSLNFLLQGITTLLNFAASVLLIGALGPKGQAAWTVYQQFAAGAVLLIGSGIPQSLVFGLASGKWPLKQTLHQILWYLLFGIVLSALLFSVLPSSWQQFLAAIPVQGSFSFLVFLWILIAVQVMQQIVQALLQVRQLFILAAVFSALGSLGTLGIYALLRIYHWPPFETAVPTLIAVSLLQVLTALVVLRAQDWPKPDAIRPKGHLLRHHILPTASVFFLANAVQFLNYKADIWIIRAFHADDTHLGIYTLAVSLVQLLWLLPNVVHTILYTRVSANSAAGLQETRRMYPRMLIYALIGGLAGWGLSYLVIPWWYGEAFTAASSLIGILLPGIVLISGALCLSAWFAGSGQARINLQGSLIGLALTLLAGFSLIPFYGIYGAAWASVISYSGTALFYSFMFFRSTQHP